MDEKLYKRVKGFIDGQGVEGEYNSITNTLHGELTSSGELDIGSVLCDRTKSFIDAQIISSGTLYGEITPSSLNNKEFSYNRANDKPQINSVTLIGDKTATELELQREMEALSNIELDMIFKL